MAPSSDAEVAEHLRAILSSPEFQEPLGYKLVEQLRRWLEGVLNWLGALSPLALTAIVLACLAVLGAVGVQIWYALRQRGGRSSRASAHRGLSPHPDLGFSPQALYERARALASQGRLRDAARTLQQALLLSFCQKRGLAWRSTLGDWEWLNLLGAPDLVDFTRRTQRLAFGGEPTQGAFDECLALYHRLSSEGE